MFRQTGQSPQLASLENRQKFFRGLRIITLRTFKRIIQLFPSQSLSKINLDPLGLNERKKNVKETNAVFAVFWRFALYKRSAYNHKVAANFYNKLEYAKLLLIICTGNTSHYKESDLIVHYRRLFPVQCHLIQRPQEVHPANTQVKKNLQ